MVFMFSFPARVAAVNLFISPHATHAGGTVANVYLPPHTYMYIQDVGVSIVSPHAQHMQGVP